MVARRLEDLWVLGKDVTFDDGQGEPVTVWLQLLNIPDQELAARKASAKRATVLMDRHDPTSEGWLQIRDQVEALDDDYVVELLAMDELIDRVVAIEAEEESKEPWSTDGYLQGLRDAWEPPDRSAGLKDRFAEDPEDSEAKKVFEELKRWQAAVDEQLDPLFEVTRQRLRAEGQAELRARATKLLIDEAGKAAFNREYQRCEVWLGTRCADDHDKRYWADRASVDRLSDALFLRLLEELASITVGPTVGKDSPDTLSSLPSSTPPPAPETEPSSGLAAVPA